MLCCIQGSAPYYLSADFIQVADLPSRQRLCSFSTNSLFVQPPKPVTFSDRVFSVAGANLWNVLPHELTSQQSHLSFQHQVKTPDNNS